MSTNTTPQVVCDAYSGGCVTMTPITPVPTSVPAPVAETLPHTGGYITYGEVITIALALILVGVALVTMLRARKA